MFATWLVNSFGCWAGSLGYWAGLFGCCAGPGAARSRKLGANILLELQNEQDSINLQAYLTELNKGSSTWNTDTLIDGVMRFAKLIGPEKAEYYDNPLKGLHYESTFIRLWNQSHPQVPITLWDQEFRRQCPPSWSYELSGDCKVLIYQGDSLSQGFDELIRLATLDCGMASQLLWWYTIRFVTGNELFEKNFKFPKGRFILTQTWHQELTESGTDGSLLNPFYDDPFDGKTADFLELKSRFQTRAVCNHPKYLAKHPGGTEQRHNVTRIDGSNIVFDPLALRNILTDAELEQRFIQLHNAPRDSADFEKLVILRNLPDLVNSAKGKTFGTLAKEA